MIDRRAFVLATVALGLGGAGFAQAAPREPGWVPVRRGGGGALRALWWQAATMLNPHLSLGLKDVDGARLCYEPLVAFDADGAIVPVLAREVPSVEDGTVSRDGLSMTWRLRSNVTWQDGRPFGADDVIFTWEYAADPATGASTFATYDRVQRMERLDDHTVRVIFKRPTPFWAQVGGLVIPRHVFQPWRGARAREAPANLKPIGTGPYRIVEFRPGDVIRAELNPHYHVPNRPFFDTVEVKGGGDAVSAARAVLQTGEYDYAWNLQVEDDVLRRLERGGKGRVVTTFGGTIEHLLVNQTDPWREMDGERSSTKSVHPFLTDPAVRAALRLLVDRAAIQAEIYGRAGVATGAYLNAPARFRSARADWEFNVEKASQALDAGGWRRGPDGVRARQGVRLKILLQTSINAPRQKTQQIVKQACARAGIEVELKSVAAATYFSSDPANPDTASHFHADLQMYGIFMGAPDPEGMMRQFTSSEVAARANQWQRRNVSRFRSDEYDGLFRAAEVELDPVKRAGLFIKMNDLIVQQAVVVPISWRGQVAAVSNRLKDVIHSGWESDFWRLAWWHT